MELVIDRSKWLRGEGGFASRLLREYDGKMCCLGFFGLALGMEPACLRDRHRPDDGVVQQRSAWPDWLVKWDATRGTAYGSDKCFGLMGANDDKRISDAAREHAIAEEFAKHGVEVRFVDSTEQPPAGPSNLSPVVEAGRTGNEPDGEEDAE